MSRQIATVELDESAEYGDIHHLLDHRIDGSEWLYTEAIDDNRTYAVYTEFFE